MAALPYARQSFLSSLTETDRADLLSLGHGREWNRGDVLFHAGDRADSAIVLVAGLVKVHKVAADGADVVLALVGPGDLLGEVLAVRDGVRSASTTAVEPVRAIVIAVPDFRAFMSTQFKQRARAA